MSHGNATPKYHCLLCDISFINKKSSLSHLGSKRHTTQKENILSEKRKERKLIRLQIDKDKTQCEQLIEQYEQLKAKFNQSREQLEKSQATYEEIQCYIKKVKSYKVDQSE